MRAMAPNSAEGAEEADGAWRLKRFLTDRACMWHGIKAIMRLTIQPTCGSLGVPQLKAVLAHMTTSLLLAHAALLTLPTQAQNSRESVEAVRNHRAETGTPQSQSAQKPSKTSPAAPQPKPDTNHAYRSSADPTANPNASLKSCMDRSGLNIAARDRCIRQHCQGRWGQGQCPPGSDTGMTGDHSKRSNTPLGRCLAEAGNNPFRRDGCGWRHCKPHWDTPECKALVPPPAPQSN